MTGLQRKALDLNNKVPSKQFLMLHSLELSAKPRPLFTSIMYAGSLVVIDPLRSHYLDKKYFKGSISASI